MKSIAGWVIVTGASSGIGKETALSLLSNGYNVVVTSRNKALLQDIYGTYHHNNCRIVDWDLGDIESIKDYAKHVYDEVGGILGIIHCAGVQKTKPLHLIKAEDISIMFNINAFAGMLLVSEFSKKKRWIEGKTSFVLLSSIAAREGAKGNSIYAASKGALEGFVADVACELAERGIRINCIAPGQVMTEMTERFFNNLSREQIENAKSQYPLGFGYPKDIVSLAVFLLSEKARWITGQTYVIDGGHLVRQCY